MTTATTSTETLRPSWAELLPLLMNKAAAGDQHAIGELRRMARAADLAVSMKDFCRGLDAAERRSATSGVLA